MVIDIDILYNLMAQASLRLRMNLNLRNSSADQLQRMLNDIESGLVLPIHRHRSSSKTVICIRGHFEEYFYDEEGNLTESFDMVSDGQIINIHIGQ